MKYDEITFIIKTFERYNCLRRLIKSIIKFYPECKIVVGDDSYKSSKEKILKEFSGHDISYYDLPYECGLSYGRNYMVSKVKTKYLLLCDDDFVVDKKTDLSEPLRILKEKNLDILGGYARNYKIIKKKWHYLYILGQKIFRYEIPSNYIGTFNYKNDILYIDYIKYGFPEYKEAEIVMNFFLAKTSSLLKCQWDDSLKLQEHTPFFYKAKLLNLKVAFTNKLSIEHRPIQNKNYKRFRDRDYTYRFMNDNNIKKIISSYDNGEKKVKDILKLDNILVSVIVPMYNAEKKMDVMVRSIIDQLYTNIEVIIVDNNSTDNSLNKLKEIVKGDKRFKILQESKKGPNSARYKGYKEATGDYLYFVDIDDKLEDDAILNFVIEITKNKSDIVVGDYNELTSDFEYLKTMKGVKKNSDNLKLNKDFILNKLATWNKVFKKSIVTDDAFIDTGKGQDTAFSIINIMHAKKITYINKVVYNYVLYEDGITANVSVNKFKAIIDTFSKMFNETKKLNCFDTYSDELNYLKFTHLSYNLLRSSLLTDKKERIEVYDNLIKELKDTNYKSNKYYKKSKAYRILTFFTMKKGFYNNRVFNFMVRQLFNNRVLNKIFKKLDK